jgi:hypothetical protein
MASDAHARWTLIQPPRTTHPDCSITYRENTPTAEWGEFRAFETRDECERAREELARRARRRSERFSRWEWGAPFRWVTKWFFDPSTWEECERVADYWALEHTRCAER